MGGLGSGNHWRYGSKATCESFTRIELPVLKRRGMLQPGYYGSLSWNMGGEPCGNIHFRMHKSGMELIYKYQEHGSGEWQHVNEHVPFLYTAQHIPSVRRWFGCLSCGRRCAVLYGGTHYRCRKCWNLAYQSQHEAPYLRALSQAQKFRQRLGGSPCTDDPFPDKPKGMHWQTYDGLCKKGASLDARAETEMLIALCSFLGPG